MIERPQSEIAEEIGERVIEASDQLNDFAPDLEATFPFEIDGEQFVIAIRKVPK